VAEPLPGGAARAQGELRRSSAAAQGKTALLWHQNQWCGSQGSTPTTQLFKVSMGPVGCGLIDVTRSMDNE
jgi:serine/threonine-protein kinase HipA